VGCRTTPAGVAAGIGELVSRYELPVGAASALSALLDLVATDPHSPTTVRRPADVLNDHLADSLVALDVAHLRRASVIADLGSGAGFPGLPLAVALPNAQIVLVESSARKCDFIERAIARCGISNARSLAVRAEAWPEGRSQFEVVTARALAPLAVVAEYAAPLLALGGVLLAWRGGREPTAEAAAAHAATALGLELRETRSVHPYRGAEHRHLHLMVKVTETPSRFPRRPGIARKRPLGEQ
jgi:16S rRNA (guanine527-N7)-methyltransferase